MLAQYKHLYLFWKKVFKRLYLFVIEIIRKFLKKY